MKSYRCLFLFILSAIIALSGTGCKSVPEKTGIVEPLDLLDNNSSFYIRVPSSADKNLISRIISSSVNGISSYEADMISQRIDVVYAGLNRRKNKTDYQISASCNLPQAAVSKAFSRKNGWTKDLLSLNKPDGHPVNYSIYSNSTIFAAFPSSSVACAGRNVPSMIETFHNILFCRSEAEALLNKDIYSWLLYDCEAGDDRIAFFASKPQSFLTILTGAVLNFNLSYVRGFLENDPKRDDQFVMQIEFEFKDIKFVPAAQGSLAVAFGLTGSDIFLETPSHLVVKNIKINKKQLYNILVL